jgi:hypothetical protein
MQEVGKRAMLGGVVAGVNKSVPDNNRHKSISTRRHGLHFLLPYTKHLNQPSVCIDFQAFL